LEQKKREDLRRDSRTPGRGHAGTGQLWFGLVLGLDRESRENTERESRQRVKEKGSQDGSCLLHF
jgi:hypothetical protein